MNGAACMNKRSPNSGTRSPAAAPREAKTTLSARSCRTSRSRPAPSAARIVNSRWRRAARATSRLATLAQAISSTKLTAPSRMSSSGRVLPYSRSCSVATSTVASRRNWGRYSFVRSNSAVSSVRAWAMVTPGASRPTTRTAHAITVLPPPVGSCSGLQNFAPLGKSKLAGSTPTTVTGVPSMTIERPRIPGSPPKRCCHIPWLRITTALLLGSCSPGVKFRPSIG